MQDGNAEFAVGVDVWVEEGAVELEGGRGVGVVLREVHLGFEVATVVERVWVDDDEGDVPVEDVIFVELSSKLEGVYGGVDMSGQRLTSTLTHFSCERALYSF